jgi:hypothetical protein
MKKKIAVFSILLCSGLLLGSCNTPTASSTTSQPAPTTSSTPSSKISVTLDKKTLSLKIGETGQLTATTNPAGKTVIFSTSDGNVASVSKTGLVMAVGVGKASITVTTSDSLSATCEVTVADEDVPAMPTDNHQILISTGDPVLEEAKPSGLSATKDSTTGVTHVTWDETAAKDTTWKNDVGFEFAAASKNMRATKACFQIRANKAITVYYKLVDENWDVIMEGEKSISTTYTAYDIEISAEKRYMLATSGRFMIYLPKAGTSELVGSADIANVYFAGDAEPGEKPSTYDPDAHTVIYDYNLAHATESDYIDDQTTGKITWAYTAGVGLVFTNTDYNDWAPFTYKFPEYEGDTKIDYSGCELLVIKLKASEGVDFKYRDGWNADMSEKQITSAVADKDIYLTIARTTVTPWDTIMQLVPSYRLSGYETGTLTTTIEAIQVVKTKVA